MVIQLARVVQSALLIVLVVGCAQTPRVADIE